MNTKPTNTLFRLFFSIAITVGLVLVYAKPLPNNYDQAGGGYLIEQQQQQQPPNAGEGEFVVAYGGDDIPTNYNLDNIPNPDELLNTDPSSFSAFSNPPTPTIQENPTFTTTEKSGQVALEWIDNLMNNIREKFGGDTELSPPPPPLPTPTLKEKFQNFPCSGSRSICCSGNMNKAGISGKHTCANKNNYWPLLANNAESIPLGKLPCVEPVFLQTCSRLENYSSYTCFSDCKAGQQ